MERGDIISNYTLYRLIIKTICSCSTLNGSSSLKSSEKMRSVCPSFLSNGKNGELLAIPASTFRLFAD